ncbi:hypothetical protein [Streptomyces sp. AK04-3B]|nr:hypothetical protein [Streptomyces sp. AK04-3B]MDX3798600.1 hypothetical protein [Streptomyces sp. AK04-3B]
MDEKYLIRAPGSSARIGQRPVVTEDICRQALDDAKALRETLINVLR